MMQRVKHTLGRGKFLFALLGMFMTFTAAPQSVYAQTLDAILRAQEDVNVAIEPTTIVFDFYLADQHRGEVLMTYTDQWGKFHDPEGVLDLMPEITDRQAVFDLLNHGEIMGLERTIEGVGQVQINPSNFQAQLKLEPAVLDIRKTNTAKVDVDPALRPKLANAFSVVANNNLEGEGFDSTLRHQNAFSFGRARLELDGTYADNAAGYNLENALAAYETDETLYQAGALQTRGLEFARGQNIMGIRIGTNIDTLFDDESIKGDSVTVFIPGRARVNAYADGRLVYTDILDFGLQELDTTSFPLGSYDLRIEITEQATGRTTTERQFFTKTNRLVPFGRPDWDVAFGYARDELNPNTAEPVWQARVRSRFAGNYELGVSLLGGKRLNILEPQARMFWKGLELRGNLSLTDEGDAALSAFGQYLGDKYGTLTARMRKTISGHDTTPQVQTDVFDPLVGHADLLTARWTNAFGHLQLTLSGTRTQSQNGDANFTWGPSVRYPLIASARQRLELQGDYIFKDGTDNYGGFLTYQYTPSPSPWLVNTQTSYRDGARGSQTSNITQLEYDNRASSRSPGTEVLLTNTVTQSGEGEDFVGQDVRLEHTTDTLNATFTGTHGRRGGESTGSVGLAARTNFIIDGSATKLVGGQTGQATLVVDMKGSATGETMLIKNGSTILSRVKVGERATVGLQPFKTYNITIEPEASDALVTYSKTPRTFKLVNRAVEVADYRVDKIKLVFGRLVDPTGTPLAWQRIKGASASALTDQFGNFQTEMGAGEVIYVSNRSTTCTAAMPRLDSSNEVFSYVGDILCI